MTMSHVRLPQTNLARRSRTNPATDLDRFVKPETVCGAPATIYDFDVRDVTTNAAQRSDWISDVCADCLEAAGAV